MRGNPIQFAVVREDPEIEAGVLARTRARRALLIASGGCTAFELSSRFPGTALFLLDPNPAQLELVRRKEEALRSETSRAARLRRFNVGDADPRGLSQCGNFESLFRSLAGMIREFVAGEAEWEAFFADPARCAPRLEEWIGNPWWRIAFDLAFADAVLTQLFGPAAVRHAAPGSYPAYFRGRIEAGLRRADAGRNRFLHHIFLGRYLDRPGCLPGWIEEPPGSTRFEYRQGGLEEIEDFSPFDLVSLSNVPDWMEAAGFALVASRLARTLRPGAAVVVRRLNNAADHEAALGPDFACDRDAAARALAADRSLFYDGLLIAFRREGPATPCAS